ncbi:unnamed protein product [Cuscuta campestris]|uniref:Uncharacterized protein n=1 Tax=Cuscuta campestris TaxID=132261 RepID=A0A484N2K4_9ASTE|nr:unnamed protein product [Cuscuta campestris]
MAMKKRHKENLQGREDRDALNEEIPEQDVVNVAIRGLPSEHSAFKKIIRMNNENISLSQFSGLLTSKEINYEI